MPVQCHVVVCGWCMGGGGGGGSAWVVCNVLNQTLSLGLEVRCGMWDVVHSQTTFLFTLVVSHFLFL